MVGLGNTLLDVPADGAIGTTSDSFRDDQVVSVVYTNYRGETAVRRIVPKSIWFGATDWHPTPGWLLDAYDVEKAAERSFALKDIKAWFSEH